MLDGPPRPGTFVWDELHTKDLEAAKKFYGKIFGWTGKMGEGPMHYWIAGLWREQTGQDMIEYALLAAALALVLELGIGGLGLRI